MTASKRKEIMATLLAAAKDADRRGDVSARNRAANAWHELATASEDARAPKVLTWAGRK